MSCDEASCDELLRHAAPGEHALAASARLTRVAARHHRLQSADVDRIDRDVRPHRGVDRGPQLDLVVLAAALHAGAEIDDRLLLLDRRQRVGERLQRAQPDVVVEHVELAGLGRRRFFGGGRRFVGGAGAGRGGLGGGALRCRRAVPSAASTALALAGEVGQHVERRADRGDRDEIGGAHLLLDELARRVDRALHVLRLHRADVEQQHDQPASGQRLGRHRRRRAADRRGPAIRGPAAAIFASTPPSSVGRTGEPRRGLSRDLLEAERLELLRPAVFVQLEVGRGQAAHDVAVSIAHDDVDGDQLRGAIRKTGRCCGASAAALRRRRARRQIPSSKLPDPDHAATSESQRPIQCANRRVGFGLSLRSWDSASGTASGFGRWEWLGFGAWDLGFDTMRPRTGTAGWPSSSASAGPRAPGRTSASSPPCRSPA